MLARRSSEALLAVTVMYTTWQQKAGSRRQRARHMSDRCNAVGKELIDIRLEDDGAGIVRLALVWIEIGSPALPALRDD